MIDFIMQVWKSSTGNKVMLILGMLVMLGALAGVLYGALR